MLDSTISNAADTFSKSFFSMPELPDNVLEGLSAGVTDGVKCLTTTTVVVGGIAALGVVTYGVASGLSALGSAASSIYDFATSISFTKPDAWPFTSAEAEAAKPPVQEAEVVATVAAG